MDCPSWMMNQEKYEQIGRSAGVPTHCPLYGNGCPVSENQHPDNSGSIIEALIRTDVFSGVCPEILSEFKSKWSQDFPRHYLDCPQFSYWWWNRSNGIPKSPKNIGRSPISKNLRYKILVRDNFTCQYCGAKQPEVKLEVDHRIPVSKGGTNDPDNLVTACFDCNRGKRDLLLEPDQRQ